MRLELSRRAQSDLDEIRDFSVAEFGAERAAAYLDALEGAFRRIIHFPQAGAVHDALGPGSRALGCEQHRIFYEVRADTILILRILHEAMDVRRHL